MTTLSLASGNVGSKDSCLEFPSLYFAEGPLASKLLRSSHRIGYGFWLDDPKVPRIKSRNKFCVTAKVKKWRKHDYPWPDDIDPNIKSGYLTYLSYFKPLAEKPKPVTLPFEKPLVDLEKKIIEIRNLADETGLDFSDQIGTLENKYQMALKDLYTHLTPIQRLSIARHPNRPTVLDHILNITEKWVELHGDRAGYDDPAIVTGIGSIEGKSYMCIGHQKGRNTKENILRNFAMPTPHGYRKALRMMKYADHHGLPILTFVDTPGAFADLKSEELGQGEAIAHNLRTMFGLKVPIVTVVTGEGGSGGALAIACSNKMFMMENSAFYVASPEACAAILWKSSQAAPKAAEKLKITAQEHYRLKIADGIIPEPLGGAHADPAWASQQIKSAIIEAMKELANMSTEELLHHRMLKYRHIGGFQEGIPIDPQRKRKMMPSQTSLPKPGDIESELEDLKNKILKVKGPSDPITSQAIEKLKEDVDKEMTNAFISMGLQEKLESLKLELSQPPNGLPNQPLSRSLKEKSDKLMQEFKQNLSKPGSYLGLKQKLEKLDMVNKLIEQKKKSEELKTEINSKIPSETQAKLKQLKDNWDNIVSSGAPVDREFIEELERVKTELVDVLKTANLDVVGVVKRTAEAPPAEVREMVQRLKEEIDGEIERAIEMAELGGKIEELKAKMADGLNVKEVEKVEAEIKEKIVEALEASGLKEKVESLRMEVASAMAAAAAEGMVAADNGRS
ncbi:acetyl-coenzyme A carboxylase carboxyl transferase subunit alpha, chloroplastic-like [Momordica charantia]|uniref:acetyl-CoA carboxytransferase n=1 Tax=Momordica charantia TaxID=3673 RepID=A0A6J1D2E0_MOMCH|nr:acetyl-coenzyme A carboxylase carboxyl transferase subunit alpha, chloroplastic-like [Momordica charantia]XP_022147447.1 acetyl-coenzyme A carboxylase carboxyl transferase subunit alpha, chloroplastic-like [Momordica charantia]WDW26400.1 chloroplast acetyl-CoA carboxylase carboxyl transferase subunit alpha isoform 1 [Momordica charantia]